MTKAEDNKAAEEKSAAQKAAEEKAAASASASKSNDAPESRIPDRTGTQVDPDVQKVAIVTDQGQPVDKQKTQEQIDIDRGTLAGAPAPVPTTADRLNASGFVFIDDPLTRQHYVAKRPEGQTSKDGTPVTTLIINPLVNRRPEAGLTVFVDDETSFNVPAGVDDWFAVRLPDKDGQPGEPLIPAMKEEKKRKAA